MNICNANNINEPNIQGWITKMKRKTETARYYISKVCTSNYLQVFTRQKLISQDKYAWKHALHTYRLVTSAAALTNEVLLTYIILFTFQELLLDLL